MYDLSSFPHRTSAGERRLVRFSGFETFRSFIESEDMREFAEDLHIDNEDKEWFRAFEESEGAQDVTAHFAHLEPAEITQEALDKYLQDFNPADLTDAEQQLDTLFEDLESGDDGKRVSADRKIQAYLKYLQQRSMVHAQAQEALTKMRPERQDRVMEATNYMLDNEYFSVKKTLKAFTTGYRQASGTERALMIGGVVVGIYALYNAWKNQGTLGKWTRGTLTLGGTALLGALAYDTFQTGRRRMQHPDEQSWRKAMNKDHIEEVRTGLQNTARVPQRFLDEIENSDRFIYAIVNLSTLSAQEFGRLYRSHEGAMQIPDGAEGYPQHPFTPEDEANANISASQRFAIMREMAEALGFFDPVSGEFDIPEEKEGQSILYLALEHRG